MQTLVTRFGKKMNKTEASPVIDDANVGSPVDKVEDQSLSLNVDFNEIERRDIIDATKLKPGDEFADRVFGLAAERAA